MIFDNRASEVVPGTSVTSSESGNGTLGVQGVASTIIQHGLYDVQMDRSDNTAHGYSRAASGGATAASTATYTVTIPSSDLSRIEVRWRTSASGAGTIQAYLSDISIYRSGSYQSIQGQINNNDSVLNTVLNGNWTGVTNIRVTLYTTAGSTSGTQWTSGTNANISSALFYIYAWTEAELSNFFMYDGVANRQICLTSERNDLPLRIYDGVTNKSVCLLPPSAPTLIHTDGGNTIRKSNMKIQLDGNISDVAVY